MAWLLRQGEVLASVDVPGSLGTRARAMAGRHSGEGGALLLSSVWLAHSIGARFPLDIAYLDAALVVVAIARIDPNRVGLPRARAPHVLAVEAGAFERWRLAPGDQLEIKQ